jgi:hypothetical protein
MESVMTQVFEQVMVPVGKIGSICAWEGCTATFQGDMPHGWINLLAYWAPRPLTNFWEIPVKDRMRDACLCPEHTRQLDSQLKPIGRALDAPAQGHA